MTPTSKCFLLLALPALLGACDPPMTSPDAGGRVDAGRMVDAGPGADAGPMTDAGPMADAGPPMGGDSGPDAGFTTPACGDPSTLCPANDCYETAHGAADNNALNEATPLTAGDTVSGVICSGDEDWFQVIAPIGCTLQVDLIYSVASGDLDIRLETPLNYNPAYPPASAQRTNSSSNDDDDSFTWVSRTDQPHYLRVTSATGENDYTLTAAVTCPPVSCATDDRYGDNDAIIDSISQNENEIDDTFEDIVCGDDADWYTHKGLSEDPNCRPAAVLTFDPIHDGQLTVEMRISDVTEWPNGTVETSPGRIVADFGSNPSGTGTFVVRGQADVPYRIHMACGQLL